MARHLRFAAALPLAVALACAHGCAQGTSTPPDGGIGPGMCSGGQELCGDDCVALDRDALHCGMCGNACADGERCADGACVVSCPSGQSACEIGGGSFACVSTSSDPMNCGACGNVCASGEVCSESACGTSCAAGLELCTLETGGLSCADLTSDPRHCGACNASCAMGETCVTSACELVCPGTQTACGGLCVDLTTDDNNCGACGTVCGVNETCEGSMCVTSCPTGTTDCGGICRDLMTDSSHCGACDAACGAGEICNGGSCELTCPSGQTPCVGSCVFTDRDPLHCGACSNACPAPVGGSASCVSSACTSSCPTGQTDCSGTCRNLASDSANCGACGRACGTGERCVTASCIPDIPDLGGPTFQVTSLSATGCSVIDHEPLTGDDRGGVAVSTSQVFVTGDNATARYNRNDLTAGATIPERVDTFVSNVRTGQIFALGNAGAVLPAGGGMVTHLINLSTYNLVPLTSGHVTLSTPINVTASTFGSTVGLFSGYDRVVIHNGTNVYSINTTTGAVTDLGAMAIPSRTTCENWAYWGLAETDGASTNLVFVQNSTSIVKVRVPTGAIVQTFPFTALSDMCSIGAYQPGNRWYFHHEYNSQFTSVVSETVGYCDATFDIASGNFRVTALTANNCAVYDHNLLTGDDRGGLVVGGSYVFYSGDTATARFNRTALTSAPAQLGKLLDSMIGNIRTGQVYALGAGGQPLGYGGGTVTQLVPLNATSGTPTTPVVTLSMPIDVVGTSGVGLFSGYDRAVIHTGTRVYHIALPAGTVTDLGAMARPSAQTCENWAYWGLAEYYGGQLYLSYRQSGAQAIQRARVPDGVTSTLASFTNLSDMCSFTVVPALNRWYFHHEYTSQFAPTGTEMLGFCTATWTSP